MIEPVTENSLTPVWAAAIGGAAGALVSLIGVYIDHSLARRRAAHHHRIERLEQIAAVLDQIKKSLMHLPYRALVGSDIGLGDVFRLQTLSAIYLPGFESEAQAIVRTMEGLTEKVWQARVSTDGFNTLSSGGRGIFLDHARRQWDQDERTLMSLLNDFGQKLALITQATVQK